MAAYPSLVKEAARPGKHITHSVHLSALLRKDFQICFVGGGDRMTGAKE